MSEQSDRQDYKDIGMPCCTTSCLDNWMAELCYQSYCVKNALATGFANTVRVLLSILNKMP